MAEDNNGNETMATEAPLAPITSQRKVRDDLEDSIPKPYLARAFVTPDTDHPDGTEGRESKGMTVLQRHASFFDRDNNGVIYPWESYEGFRAIGFNPLVSGTMSMLINIPLSLLTKPGWIPSPLFPIYVDNIHRAKHGGDSGTYDTEGRYVPVNLENIFSKYARTEADKLTFKELWEMTEANRAPFDFFGTMISKLEWGFLYALAKDENGFLPKEAVRGIFDGSILEYYANKTKEAKDKKA